MVIERAQKKSKSRSITPEQEATWMPSETRIARSPKLDEDRGLVDFFTNNYASPDNIFIVPEEFEGLLKIDIVRFSTQSVGAMALARLKRDPYYYRKAQERYGTALIALAEMWRLNEGIEQDATLLSVLLLSFYEVLASYDTFQHSWLAHIRGLGGILQIRRQRNVNSRFGTIVMVQSESQMIHNALQTWRAVPSEVVDRHRHMLTLISISQRPSADLDALLIRLAKLQATLGSPGTDTSIEEQLSILDQDFSQWMDKLPLSWAFSSQPSPYLTISWWDARHDTYTSRLKAYCWNKARAARLVIRELRQNQPLCTFSGDVTAVRESDDQVALSEIRRLIADVCATLPPFYRPLSAAQRQDGDFQPPLGTIYWLLWPLEVVGSMNGAPYELKAWILACLDRIHEITGVAKVQSVAKRLRAGRGRWIVVA